jgi:signal transduction histidine kinase
MLASVPRPRTEGSFPPIAAVLWVGTVATGLVVAASSERRLTTAAAGAALLVVVLAQAAGLRRASLPAELAASGVVLASVAATGGWRSPYAVVLVAPVVAWGLSFGLPAAGVASAAGAAAATVASALGPGLSGSGATTWVGELLLVALLAGLARRLSLAAAEGREASEQLVRLRQANELLVALRRLAAELPSSLALPDVVATTTSSLVEVAGADVAAVLLAEADGSWSVAGAVGCRVGPFLGEGDLPRGVRQAIGRDGPAGRPGAGSARVRLAERAVDGAYVPLVARGELVGALVAERFAGSPAFCEREREAVRGIAEQAAVAIDNARLAARLRDAGADEERVRIARGLHDDVGQDLACLGLRLEALSRDPAALPVAAELAELRGEVRRVLARVRETLCDLRTDVTAARGIGQTLEAFTRRVEARSGAQVSLELAEEGGRLPLSTERALWRIAQEALANAERHARASRITVRWRRSAEGALVEVADDGVGLDGLAPGKAGQGGLLGMRERAAAIGASLEITSDPGRGTTVRCRMGR